MADGQAAVQTRDVVVGFQGTTRDLTATSPDGLNSRRDDQLGQPTRRATSNQGAALEIRYYSLQLLR